jgi:hypothetical protein
MMRSFSGGNHLSKSPVRGGDEKTAKQSRGFVQWASSQWPVAVARRSGPSQWPVAVARRSGPSQWASSQCPSQWASSQCREIPAPLRSCRSPRESLRQPVCVFSLNVSASTRAGRSRASSNPPVEPRGLSHELPTAPPSYAPSGAGHFVRAISCRPSAITKWCFLVQRRGLPALVWWRRPCPGATLVFAKRRAARVSNAQRSPRRAKFRPDRSPRTREIQAEYRWSVGARCGESHGMSQITGRRCVSLLRAPGSMYRVRSRSAGSTSILRSLEERMSSAGAKPSMPTYPGTPF